MTVINYNSTPIYSYIPEWLEITLEWLASYTTESQLPKFDTNSEFNLNKLAPGPEDSLLIIVFSHLCTHLEEHYSPFIRSSYIELFKELNNKFEINFEQKTFFKGYIKALQLFLLLLTPFVRNYIRFIFSYLVKISENPYFSSEEESQNEILNFLLLSLQPILIRPSSRPKRHTSEIESVSNGIFHYIARNPVTSFEIPEEILDLYKLHFPSLSFTEFVASPKQTEVLIPQSTPLNNSDTDFLRSTETKFQLEKLLENVFKQEGLDPNKRLEFLHTFSVTYPEVYKKCITEMT